MTDTTTAAPPKRKSRRKPVPTPTTAPSQDDALAALAALDAGGPRMVPTDQLVPHPRNPRREHGDLTELTDSIRAHGVQQNLLVVPDSGDPDRFRVVIGHRRAAAALNAGLAQVPAVVRPDLSESDQLALMLVENVHRSQLTLVEEADGYQALLDDGLSRAALSKITGSSKATVSTRLKVAAAPTVAKERLHRGVVTLDDVLRLEEADLPDDLADELAGHLGTHQFGWRLKEAVEKRQREQSAAEWEAKFTERGARRRAPEDPRPDGHRPLYTRGEFTAVLEKIDEAWLWQSYEFQEGVLLWQPLSAAPAVEVPGDGTDQPTEAVLTPEQLAEREQLHAAEAAVRHAAELRAEFLAPLLDGKRKLTKIQSADLLRAFVVDTLRDGASFVPYYSVRWDRAETRVVFDDRGPDRTMLGALAHLYDVPRDADGHFQIGSWAVGIAAPDSWLSGWGADDDAEEIAAWYELLGRLGYEPSQPELDALARGVFDAEDEAES